MGLNQLCGDGKPKPGAPFSRHALKGLEETRSRLLGDAGARVAHLDHRDRALSTRGEVDLAAAVALGFQRLHGVAERLLNTR